MRNIVIIPQVNVGIRPHPFGIDGEINFFKKSLSQKLKNKLNERLTEENINYVISVDYTYDYCEKTIRDELVYF